MFGLGTWELLLILIAALVFIGPSKLPGLARTMGKGMRDVRRAMAGFEDEVRRASDLTESAAAPSEPPTQAVHRGDADSSVHDDEEGDGEHHAASVEGGEHLAPESPDAEAPGTNQTTASSAPSEEEEGGDSDRSELAS